jgi:hypothetical protein
VDGGSIAGRDVRRAAPAYASLRAHGTRAARRESAAAVATREATGGGRGAGEEGTPPQRAALLARTATPTQRVLPKVQRVAPHVP